VVLMIRQGRWLLFAVLASACSSSPQAVDSLTGPSAEVRKFTGTATKVVWVQGDGSDPYAGGDNLVLMGMSPKTVVANE
jgi:hypothetical protein